MKKLTVLAFLAALGLFALGCGDAELTSGSYNSAGGTNGGKTVDLTDPVDAGNGYTNNTVLIDPETGEKTNSISDIKSDGTGATPPLAPTYVRSNGSTTPTPAPPL
jgi:hypothetical protein